jgi:hypothetical protein
MIKKLTLRFSIVILVTCYTVFIKQQSVSAQVDISLLTEVAKSCKKDTVSSDYYKQMGFEDGIYPPIGSRDLLNSCIQDRYYHSLISSKFPWLASTDEIIPGYPGSVLVSNMAFKRPNIPGYPLIDCIVSQDPSSNKCVRSTYFYDQKSFDLVHVCPSCVVSENNVSSANKMRENFIKWFLNLDKPTRRKVLSTILGGDPTALKNRSEIHQETSRAVEKYDEIREKVAREEQNRRRREVMGD